MKTSFYFVVWIVIYPLLGFLGNAWIDEHSFFVALICVWALSWFLNQVMPETIAYERKFSLAQIMNEVYTCNVDGFRRRLSRMSMIEFIGLLYFVATFLFTLFIMKVGGSTGIFELIVFGLLAAGTIINTVKLQKYSRQLRKNPDPQESVAIVEEMGMDYTTYYEERQNSDQNALVPPAPRNFSIFQIFSLIAAGICTLLGIVFIILAILYFVGNTSFGATSFGIMFLLYGSLATYYGIKDCISSFSYFKLKSYIPKVSI